MGDMGLTMHRRRARVAIAVLTAAAAVGRAHAQGTVSGVLTLEERPDADRGDLRNAVVYLEPSSRSAVIPASDVPSLRSGAIAMRGREFILHAWHERGVGEVTREIVVPAGGLPALRLVVDARTYVDTPHFNKFGRPYAVIRDDRY